MNVGIIGSHEPNSENRPVFRFRRYVFHKQGGIWVRPPGVRFVEVLVVGAGGNGDGTTAGSTGGIALAQVDLGNVSSVQVTVGADGSASASSFGRFVTCTAGASVAQTTPGTASFGPGVIWQVNSLQAEFALPFFGSSNISGLGNNQRPGTWGLNSGAGGLVVVSCVEEAPRL